MSASIFRLLADELDISDQKAKKLLSAMLREVKKRAGREGVRLPDLGKFKKENGELVFEPGESLSRAVNHRFEGLSSEDLASAPSQDTEETKDEGPSTITLGYQDSSWSPLESSEDEDASSSTDDDGPDTAEFQVPDADSAADTDELQVGTKESESSSGATVNETSSPNTPEPSDSTTHTEELYPLVEDVPDGEEEHTATPSPKTTTDSPSRERDPAREKLSGIWSSEELAAGASNFGEDDDAEPSSSSALENIPTDADSFEDRQESFDSDSPSPDPSSSPESPSFDDADERESTKSSSSFLRFLVTLLVIGLLGGGAWYILGQRGMVSPPGPTLARLQSQVQSLVGGTTSASASSSDAEGSANQSSQQASSADKETSTSPNNSSASASTGGSASETPSGSSSTRTIDRAAGGWSIIVASRADREAATNLMDTYRQRFSSQNLPVDVLEGTVENSTRYRVGVGQFSSQREAESFIDKNASALPDGAWSLQLQ